MNITVLDGYAANPGDLSWQPLERYGKLTIYDRTSSSQLIERAAQSEILLTNKVLLMREQIDQLPRLRYIGVNATGYNVVDAEYARKKGIVVTNIPAYSTESVAQMVFAHLLNVALRVDHYAQLNRKGRWSANPDFCYWDTPLIELQGKSIGIVGMGNIGKKVSEIAHAFGMEVNAYTSKERSQLDDYVRKTTFEGLLAISDIVTLHCPLNAATDKMINARTLKMMKQGAILINTGRGGLIDEQAVAMALATGQLSAFCADVLTDEPPSPTCPLLHCANAYLTPHIAWATREARERLISIAVDNVRAFCEGKPQNVVGGVER